MTFFQRRQLHTRLHACAYIYGEAHTSTPITSAARLAVAEIFFISPSIVLFDGAFAQCALNRPPK